MKFSFNILRPFIFVLCGLGYLPLQSADTGTSKEFASKNIKVESKITDSKKIEIKKDLK